MAPVFVCAVFAFLSVGALAHPLTFYKNNRQVSAQVQDVPCGGGSCPDGNTCCSLGDDSYGCCPRLNAVCCSDGEHCCPSGYSCGATDCQPNNSIHPLRALARRPAAEPAVLDVPCGDGTSCADGTTCCADRDISHACCPGLNAVCCSDGVYCCPSGYTCSGEYCQKDGSIHPLLTLARRPAAEPAVQDVPCGDGACPDENTCCSVGDDSYGCCPKPNAVCCSDGKHCCPNGYSCGATDCQPNNSIHPLRALARRPAAEPAVLDVPCGDGTSCADGTTCCADRDISHACCPGLNAVCCSDGVYCCPSGYTCSGEYCQKDGSIHPLLTLARRPAAEPAVQDVPCGDGACPDENTCCSVGDDSYGCCPKPNAVCCSDGKHCCPNGYSCGATDCQPNNSIHPLRALARRPAAEPAVLDVPCGDGTSCADGTTCCADRDISHACCPGLNAVCCSDGVYCCPSGYTCSGEYCQKDGSIHPLLTLARRPAAEPQGKRVQ